MGERCDVTLTAGLWRDGRCERSAVVDVLDASSRRTLVEELHDETPARRVSALLASMTASIGEVCAPSLDDVRELTIGDRDRIVLALRRALGGDGMECLCACTCGELLQLELSISGLLDGTPADPAPREAERTSSGTTVRVRSATGTDHEDAAHRALDDPEDAVRALLSRCLVEPPPGDADSELLGVVSQLLEELDPGAEILLRGTCPACEADVVAQLDPGAYLWAELEQWHTGLELDIHMLASHYHWSEAEIVALEPRRRARYIALVDDDLVTL